MSTPSFIAADVRALLARHDLDRFEALWDLQLDTVDEPNRNRRGWSSVCRLELLDEQGRPQRFYLKRQDNHLTRNWRAPLGEPTFAREFRFIQVYARRGIPALEAAFYAERRLPGHKQAILLTRALEGYQDAQAWQQRWQGLQWPNKRRLVTAAAALVRRLHGEGLVHRCLYFKHLFLKDGDGVARARLIDLEKTRRAWWGRRDRVADLEMLLRRGAPLPATQHLRFLLAYMAKPRVDDEVRALAAAVIGRHEQKR